MHWLSEMLLKYPELAVFLARGIGYWIGNRRKAGFSFGGVTGSLLAGAFVIIDGQSNWFKGVQLITVYAFIAMMFYYIPEITV